jgi:predicted enzyme related to lactoylglutathione lyase
MSAGPVLRKVDAVTVPVPDLDSGLRFYRDGLGHEVLWRDGIGQVGLRLPDSDTELVLTTQQDYAVNWLVSSIDEAVQTIRATGGQVVSGPIDIPVGRLAAVTDPFGNSLVLLDLSKGTYIVNEDGQVTGVERPQP